MSVLGDLHVLESSFGPKGQCGAIV
jgi:hypothetical protein